MRILTVLTFGSLLATVSLCPAEQKDGAAIFQENCIGCHGADGKGTTDIGKKLQAADLTSDAVQKQSNSQLTKTVKTGQKKMPAFDQKLGDDEIKAVIAYVRQLGKNK